MKAKKKESFREWRDRKGITLIEFAKAVPSVSYGAINKWTLKAGPIKIHKASKAAVAAVYPDCPLVRDE